MRLILRCKALKARYFTTNVIKNNNDCYSPSDEYIFVNSMDDLNILHKCKNLNGSLFINGGNNIDSLEKLEHLESITGNLVILDSHILDNLYGLHNLKEIKGENLYLDNYGVTIRHNNNYMNDSHHGLCYIDNIKWDNITTTDKWFENNGNNCPELVLVFVLILFCFLRFVVFLLFLLSLLLLFLLLLLF